MAFALTVPDLGRDMAGVLIAEWYLEDGTAVDAGDVVCRVEHGFVAVELEAGGPGLLRRAKPVGSVELVGTVLGHILGGDESLAHFAASERPHAEGADASQADEGVCIAPGEAAVEVDVEPARMADVAREVVAEAVVVPFPRLFARQPAIVWDPAPGDAVSFESSLFESNIGQAQPLEEPGGSIPGLLLWEGDDEASSGEAVSSPLEERFARILAEASASAQVLTMSMRIDATEARRMVAVCGRRWSDNGLQPLVEDVVIRALSLALTAGDPAFAVGGFVISGPDSDRTGAIQSPGEQPFREVVKARENGGDAGFEDASWVLTSLAEHGVAGASPRLDGGREISFAMGAPDSEGRFALTAAYDSRRWSEGSVARLLAHIRELFEAPYAMLI